jgi:uncharacterized protein (TIGR01244 family)
MMYRVFFATLLFTSLGGFSPLAQNRSYVFQDFRAYVQITDQLSTSGQITLAQIPQIREAGYEVVINLATADEKRNQMEGFRVVQEGMTYLHIPVSWQDPSLRDLKLFFDTMDANSDRKVFVHCFANMRVSVFVFLYRTLKLNVPEDEALADLHKVWDPNTEEQWAGFIKKAVENYSGP